MFVYFNLTFDSTSTTYRNVIFWIVCVLQRRLYHIVWVQHFNFAVYTVSVPTNSFVLLIFFTLVSFFKMTELLWQSGGCVISSCATQWLCVCVCYSCDKATPGGDCVFFIFIFFFGFCLFHFCCIFALRFNRTVVLVLSSLC